VNKSIGIYLTGMLLIGFVGYQLNLGTIGDKLNQSFLEKVLTRELQKSPDNPNLYRFLGDLYYNRKDYEGVRDAYERALELRLQDPHVLNNLAWLYATCEDQSLRDPQRSLMLALLAAQLEPSSHIFDTLAESYYVNGMYPEAIAASERALATAKSNHSYYRAQIEKFKKAAAE
jgi:uncharacterized protein HemY